MTAEIPNIVAGDDDPMTQLAEAVAFIRYQRVHNENLLEMVRSSFMVTRTLAVLLTSAGVNRDALQVLMRDELERLSARNIASPYGVLLWSLVRDLDGDRWNDPNSLN
jgi:hypothetical protein